MNTLKRSLLALTLAFSMPAFAAEDARVLQFDPVLAEGLADPVVTGELVAMLDELQSKPYCVGITVASIVEPSRQTEGATETFKTVHFYAVQGTFSKRGAYWQNDGEKRPYHNILASEQLSLCRFIPEIRGLQIIPAGPAIDLDQEPKSWEGNMIPNLLAEKNFAKALYDRAVAAKDKSARLRIVVAEGFAIREYPRAGELAFEFYSAKDGSILSRFGVDWNYKSSEYTVRDIPVSAPAAK